MYRTCQVIATAVNLVLVAVSSAGCGAENGSGPTPPMPETTTVAFTYDAPTATDPNIAAAYPDCVRGVASTHIHPSWREFAHVDLTSQGERGWTLTFTDVPVGAELTIQIGDPNACAARPDGFSTENVYANGVLLTRVVPTPGRETEPALALRVAADGTVTP